MMKTHIYDFTQEELEEIRRADAEIELRESMRKHGRDTTNCGGDRRSGKYHEFSRIKRTGNPVWEYRTAHRLTQKDLAEQMHTSQESVSSWERGKCKIPVYAIEWIKEREALT